MSSKKKKVKNPSKLNKKAKKNKKPELTQSPTPTTPEPNNKSKKKTKTKITTNSRKKQKSTSLVPSKKKKKIKKIVSNKENIPNNDKNITSKPMKKKKKKATTISNSTSKKKIKKKADESKTKPKTKPVNKSKSKTSSNIASIKKLLLSKDTSNAPTASEKKNVSKQSSKKNPISSKQKVKKRKKMTRSNSYNSEISKPANIAPQRRKISDIYSFGKNKKKKPNVLNVIKQPNVRKKKSDENEKKVHKKKKKKHENNKVHKVKKAKIAKPANTERIIRKKVKTKTKRKELYVIGDYVEFGETKCGVIRYKGYINKRTGIWYGVELIGKDKNGECNGNFCGEQYFECADKCGVFIMYSQIDRRMDSKQIDKIMSKQKKKKKIIKKPSLSDTLSKQMIAASNKENSDNNIIKQKKVEPVKKKKIVKKKKSISSIAVSKTPQLASQSKSQSSKLPGLSLTNVQNIQKSKSQIVNSHGISMTPRGTSRRTNSNLTNILSRGRKVDSLPKEKKRTRSLSNTRKDNSWMTHKNKDNASERIKSNISKQKQLDLSSLMKSKSKSKTKVIQNLFERHIETAKNIAAQTSTSAGGGGAVQTMDNAKNKKKLNEWLKDEEKAMQNAVQIVTDLGYCKYIRDNAVYRDTYLKNYKKTNDDDKKVENNMGDDIDLFDMNNMCRLNDFEERKRKILSKVIVKSIVTIPTIEIVEICNCDIDDNFMEIFCTELMKYYIKREDAKICILSMQTNPIGDRGMLALCKVIKINHPMLTMIKLQNIIQKNISTNVCQKICEALEQNEYLIKFEFEFRHYAERDRRDRVLKRNSEKARLQRRKASMTLC